MSFNDNKQFWTEFIELYREHRALWDIKSKIYSNKHIRKEGYDALVEKCKELFPGCDEKFVKSKIEILRGSFRRELKKVQNSKKTGSGQDEVYEPSLWYFDLLLFINDQETVRQGVSSIGKRARSDPSNDEDEERVDDDLTEVQDVKIHNSGDADTQVSDVDIIPSLSTGRSSSTLSRPTAPSTPASTTTSRNSRKKKSDIDRKQELFLDAATTALSNQNKSRAFGNNVAFQLEDMERHQQVIAEKLISDVLFHGKLGNLTATSSIQTDHPTQRNFQLPTPHIDTHKETHPYLYRSVESESILKDQYTQHSQHYNPFDPYYHRNANNMYTSSHRSDFPLSTNSATSTEENAQTATKEIREYLLLDKTNVKK